MIYHNPVFPDGPDALFPPLRGKRNNQKCPIHNNKIPLIRKTGLRPSGAYGTEYQPTQSIYQPLSRITLCAAACGAGVDDAVMHRLPKRGRLRITVSRPEAGCIARVRNTLRIFSVCTGAPFPSPGAKQLLAMTGSASAVADRMNGGSAIRWRHCIADPPGTSRHGCARRMNGMLGVEQNMSGVRKQLETSNRITWSKQQ
jgi:hypothetical protein